MKALEHYRRQGWFSFATGLSSAEIQILRDRADALAAAPPADPPGVRLTPHQPEFGYLYDLALRDPLFEALAADPRLVGAVAPLLTGPISVYSSKLVFKPRGLAHRVPFHQDYPTMPGGVLKPEIWMALDDTDAGNGCLHVVPGSHLNGFFPHVKSTLPYFSLEVVADVSGAVPVALRAGEAVVFCSRLIHGSPPPLTERPRRGFIIAYQDGDPTPAHGRPQVVRVTA